MAVRTTAGFCRVVQIAPAVNLSIAQVFRKGQFLLNCRCGVYVVHVCGQCELNMAGPFQNEVNRNFLFAEARFNNHKIYITKYKYLKTEFRLWMSETR